MKTIHNTYHDVSQRKEYAILRVKNILHSKKPYLRFIDESGTYIKSPEEKLWFHTTDFTIHNSVDGNPVTLIPL